MQYLANLRRQLDNSPPGGVFTETGGDVGPRPTGVLAATVMLKSVNLGRPVHGEQKMEHCYIKSFLTFNQDVEDVSLDWVDLVGAIDEGDDYLVAFDGPIPLKQFWGAPLDNNGFLLCARDHIGGGSSRY